MSQNLYTIDLLKGEGVPIRSRPGGIAFACLLVVVPLLAATAGLNLYLDSRVVLAIQTQQVSRLTLATEALAAAVRKKNKLLEEKAEAAKMLSEVQMVLAGRTQWSPILAWVAENVSDTLVLTRLEARQNTVRVKVPAKNDPGMKIDVSVPMPELRLSVCGKGRENSSEAVRRLQENLRSSTVLGRRLDTITVSQSATTLDGQEAVQYELNCLLQPMIPPT
jgi:Tfp pilus assembly protein PilN